MSERFEIQEAERCMCGMRRFHVTDTRDGSVHRAHVGNLNPHDASHRVIREILAAERASTRRAHA